jgi:transcriptional antiterminator Rof (Rho-off)
VIESAAFHHATIEAIINKDGQIAERILTLLDVYSENKQEFLKAKDVSSGELLTLRLDDILQLTDPKDGTTCATNQCRT